MPNNSRTLFGTRQIVTIRTNGQPGSAKRSTPNPPHRPAASRCDLPENNESISRIYRYNTENNNNRCKHAAPVVSGCDCRAGTTPQPATNGSSRSLDPLSVVREQMGDGEMDAAAWFVFIDSWDLVGWFCSGLTIIPGFALIKTPPDVVVGSVN